MKPGQLLVATPLLEDPNFVRAVVFLFSTDDGAAGVVLNRPSDLSVEEVLPTWDTLAADPSVVHLGGPVRVEHAVALGTGEHAEMVTREIGLVDLEREVDASTTMTLRVFAGYAGWGPGQLEQEVEDGAWFVIDSLSSDVLGSAPADLWRSVLARQPAPLCRFANYPADPSLN